MNVTIVGAGSWGTALASHAIKLAAGESVQPISVLLYSRDEGLAQQMKLTHKNERYLKGVQLPSELIVSSHWKDALNHCNQVEDLLVIATPFSGLEETTKKILKSGVVPNNWLWLCKGIDPDTFQLAHEIIKKNLVRLIHDHIKLGVLSGPSFALEVAHGLPCALVVASNNPEMCTLTQRAFHHGSMRIYSSSDLIGVELGGAIKNIYAIATGISDGLGLGFNARAALITRGMSEMTRLGLAMGAKAETFAGLAGLGDLILTATGDLSRNRQVGLNLAKNISLVEILKNLGHVAEGVRCAKAVRSLAQRYEVEMPIVQSVCAVLFENKNAKDAVKELMSRDPRIESL